MRELKILIILIIFTGVTYWGIEPYAHQAMHPHVADTNYDFSAQDAEQGELAVKNKKDALANAEASGDAKK